MKDINPPAIVSKATKELIATCKAMNAKICKDERMTAEQVVELGKFLNKLRPECARGEWLPALEEIGLAQQRASEYMRMGKLPPVVVSKCKSVNELREAIDDTTSDCVVVEENVNQTIPSDTPPPWENADDNGENQDADPPETGARPAPQSRAERVGQRKPTPYTVPDERPEGVDASGRKRKAERPAPTARLEMMDKVGNLLPDGVRDAFADTTLEEMIIELEGLETLLPAANIVRRAGNLTTHYPFILIAKFDEYASEALHRIQLALEILRAGLPHALCPKCKGVNSTRNGSTCRFCRGCGHIPEHRYEEWKRETAGSV